MASDENELHFVSPAKTLSFITGAGKKRESRDKTSKKVCFLAGGEIRADENLIQGELGLEVKGSEEANSLPVGFRRQFEQIVSLRV